MVQSSVEWFALWAYNNTDCKPEDVKKAFQEAKTMHRKEHEDAYIKGGNCIADGWAWTIEGRKEMAALDYYETFGDAAP